MAEAGRVVAANPPAQRLGVRAGMGLASALAVAPGLQAREREARAETAALHDLACWAGRYTPALSLDPPAGLLLDVSGSLRLFGGITALLGSVSDGCRKLGFVVEAAAAPTALAARWFARCARRVVIEEPSQLAAAIGPLPIDVLDCAPTVGEMLSHIGALTLADCLQLPRAGLARRGGAAVLQQLDQALGRSPDPRPWFVPPERFTSRLEFVAPAYESTPLLFAARRLLGALTAWLAARQAGIERLVLRLEHERQPPTLLDITLGAASRDDTRLATLAGEHLARLVLPAAVLAITLEADRAQALAGVNASLFPDPRRQHEQATLLVERLRARLGHGAVQGIAAAADHRPEYAWQNCEPGSGCVELALLPSRPLWLLTEPEPLASRDGQPCRGDTLALLAGPERIESGWWDDAPAADTRRDYFVAAGHHGELLWIYHDRAFPGRWYLHGIFS